MQTILACCRSIFVLSIMMSVVAHAKPMQTTKPGKRHTITVYDKANDQTTVRTQTMLVREVSGRTEVSRLPTGTRFNLPSETLELMAHYSYPGRAPTIPGQVVLSFLSLAEEEFKYSANSQVTVDADGSLTLLGKVVIANRKTDSNISSRFLRETLQVTLSTEDFKRIVNSSKLKMRLDKTEFSITKNQLKLLRALIEELPSE